MLPFSGKYTANPMPHYSQRFVWLFLLYSNRTCFVSNTNPLASPFFQGKNNLSLVWPLYRQRVLFLAKTGSAAVSAASCCPGALKYNFYWQGSPVVMLEEGMKQTRNPAGMKLLSVLYL